MRTFISLCCLLWVAIPSATAQRFGFMIGLNYQELSDISFNDLSTRFESKDGWHVGVWMELNAGAIAIRPGIRYVDAGQLFDGINDTFPATRDNFKVSLLEPFLLVSYGLTTPVVAPYLFGGPFVRFPSFTDKTISNDLAPASAALELGIGIKITMGGIRLYPELAYHVGITNFIEDELVIDFVSLTPSGSQRLNSIALRISLGM